MHHLHAVDADRRLRYAVAGLLLAGATVACAARTSTVAVPHHATADSLRVVNRAGSVLHEHGAPYVRLDDRPNDGLAWSRTATLRTGVIELELRGRDVQGRSFVGVAFAGQSDSVYEAIYLRPFNFQAADSTRRAHAIQYVAEPAHHWDSLRREQPGVFEAMLDPAPDPNGWVHLRVVVGEDSMMVFVNRSPRAALRVRRLARAAAGRVGYFVGHESSGDFRGLHVVDDGGR